MIVHLHGHKLTIENPSAEAIHRWQGHLSPEPETCAWIDSLPAGEVLFDIGANVGTFTARAALRGLHVYAFEPEPERYLQLCRLIEKNRLDAIAYPLALYEVSWIGGLAPGRSTHTFVTELPEWPSQGALALTLDELASRLGALPDHIKIDVDGNEPEIIRGGLHTIHGAKTVMIEIDPGAPGHDEIIPLMSQMGFTFDPAQVEACRENSGKYVGLANHLFRRDEPDADPAA